MGELVPGYRIVEQIGVGAHSTIHRAVRATTGKSFAIKRVVNEGADDAKFISQVEAEYQVSHAIEHPNLRHSISIHRVKRLLQIQEIRVVMEYVEGETLQDRRPANLDAFLYIFHKIAAGLQALHESGWVHADVKPNNILTGKEGLVKIIDFGQACPMGFRKERIQGTPDYIAPEQVQRAPLDQRTDVFNLGATMYWVLTEVPYPTAIRQPARPGGIDLVSEETLRTPREINELIPGPLSQLVMDCCQGNPKNRPESMKQVSSRLEVVQAHWNRRRKEALASKSGSAAAKDPAGGGPRPDSSDAPSSADPPRNATEEKDDADHPPEEPR
ncbi:MAG: serine/threonine protein kinase [bacterium]|nr:serine/threonine protein kinase [bacterium]